MKAYAIAVLSLLGPGLAPAAARAEDSVGVVAVAEPPGPSPELAELTHQLRGIVAEKTPGVFAARTLRS